MKAKLKAVRTEQIVIYCNQVPDLIHHYAVFDFGGDLGAGRYAIFIGAESAARRVKQ